MLLFIPTFNTPMPLADLQSRARSDKELQRVVPIIRDLKENGKVIACSVQVVDLLTGKTIFLYLADCYGSGDPDLGFKKPETVIDAYDKVVHGIAFVKSSQPNQTASSGRLSVLRQGFGARRPPSLDSFTATLLVSIGREQIGHCGQGLYMAKDMCSTSGRTTAVVVMYKNMETLKLNVEAVVKVAFPDKYEDMKAI
ncbi:hypothetical protein K438DRAFT_1788099 [Mycena galopus ATCC 62051]|nr:hypothetical protein K438DRAFT_1788099 [Mycena galopus ATCC 62051]